jgi:hypothetical protein
MRARSLPVVLLVLATLATPAAAQTTPYVFGSDLQASANLALGCETQPQIAGFSGDVAFAPSGQPDCTWRSAGVFGAISPTETRGSTIPADGVITQAQVKSGPNPAPLRFVILRQVESVCCYFQSESLPVALAPNAITTVPLNLPVERNTIGGVIVYDFVAVSAASGTGSLPLSTNGHTNTFQQTETGNPSSGLYYPRMGSVPGDGRPGGGRHEQGQPGTELLVRWTWNPPGTPAVGPGPTANTGSIAPALLNRNLRVQNNRALIQLLCQGNVACAGQLDVVNRPTGGGLRAAAPKKKPKTTVYAKAKYTIKAGARSKVTVTLNAKGKALLKVRRKQKRALNLLLRITPTGGKTTSSPVTFK